MLGGADGQFFQKNKVWQRDNHAEEWREGYVLYFMGLENWETYNDFQDWWKDDQDADNPLGWVDFEKENITSVSSRHAV